MKAATSTRTSHLRFLFRFSRQHAHGLIAHVMFTAVFGCALIFTQWLSVPLLLRYIDKAAPSATVLLFVVWITAGLFLLRVLQRVCNDRLSQKRDLLRTRGSSLLVQKALTLPHAVASHPTHLRNLARAADAMGKHINAPIPHTCQTAADLIMNTVSGLILAVVLFAKLPLLATVTVVAALLSAAVHHAVTVRGHRFADRESMFDTQFDYASSIAGSTAYSKDIRVFGLVPWLTAMRDSALQSIRALIRRRAVIFFVYSLTEAVLIFLKNAVAYSQLIYLVTHDRMDIWQFVLFLTAVTLFTQCISDGLNGLSVLRRELAEAGIFREFLEQETACASAGDIRPMRHIPHTLTCADVSFTYPGADKPTLQHLSFTLHPGEKLAVVGEDNISKTTLAKLLCGLYDPDEGAVLLDGTDIRRLDRQAYHDLFSTVLHGHILPHMTVAENVSQQSGIIDEDRVWSCLEKADAAAFVCRLPQGIHTPLGHSDELSGGQLQRLLLARALFKDGDILVLDEPISALDPLAEHHLYREYDRITSGKSAVFISQRLASTRFCDRIIYLQNGTIAEEGTHEQLIARGGKYARLFELQSRYYREGRDPDAFV